MFPGLEPEGEMEDRPHPRLVRLAKEVGAEIPPVAEAPEPEPAAASGPRSTATELGRTVLDTMRGGTIDTYEQPEPNRAGAIIKWVVIGLALLWFVVPVLLDALR